MSASDDSLDTYRSKWADLFKRTKAVRDVSSKTLTRTSTASTHHPVLELTGSGSWIPHSDPNLYFGPSRPNFESFNVGYAWALF